MSDFPTFHQHLPVVSTYSTECIGSNIIAYQTASAPATNTWQGANVAIYVPFRLHSIYPVAALWWTNGSVATGNLDCGIYSEDGTKLASTGTTAQSGTSTIQSTSVSILLHPGSYYLALEASSTSTTNFAFAAGNHGARTLTLAGIAQQSVGSLPLPNTFTLATNTTFTRVPLFGFTSRSVI